MNQKKKRTTNSTLLTDTYYNTREPAGYAGALRLKKKFPHEDVSSWLASQPTYTLHKPIRRRFPTRKYKTSGPNDLWQMDLMEMIPYARINKGYRYILTCIDVFTRFARVEPLKAKDAVSVTKAIESMLSKAGKENHPRYIQTDLGKEFYNQSVSNLLKYHKINHYSVFTQFKAALVERFNRTLREKLNRYFTHNGNKIWFNVLTDIVDTYNNTPHRGIQGKRPRDISGKLDFWSVQENNELVPKSKQSHYAVGSLVRISRIAANPFRKNFDQNWSEEIFRIAAIDTRDKPVMYVLKDLKDEIIQGKFYQQELQMIDNELPSTYRIEPVIRTRGKGKHKQYLVKWHGYDESQNSWISGNQFVEKI